MIELVGKNIHSHRIAQKLTIAELAEKSGVSDSFISRLELGAVQDTHLSKLAHVAKALGISLPTLFSESSGDPYTDELVSKLMSLQPGRRTVISKTVLDLLAEITAKK